MLESGEIDAFITEETVEAAFDEMGNVVVEDFLPLIYEPVSLTAQKPELAPIINIMQKALDNGIMDHLIDLKEQGMKEYALHKFFMRLDARELAYLRENTKVAYLAEFDNYPLSFYNSNEEQWQGIAFDIIEKISALTGLSFEPINKPNTTFSDLMSMLENGEGAMISELIRNESREGRFLWPVNETLSDNFAAISLYNMPNTSIHRIMRYKVGIQTDTAYADLFNAWFPDHPNVIEYVDSDAAFKGLENGEVDIIMYSMRHLLTATHYHENPGFKANIVFDYIFTSTFGFNINEDVLCSIVDKSMDFIDNDAITAQWMRRTFDYRSKIIQSQRPWLIGSSILLFFIIVLLVVFFHRTYRAKARLAVLHKEVMKINEASSRFVPTQFVKNIGVDNITNLKLGSSVNNIITIMFFDIRHFSVHSQMMSTSQTFNLVNKIFGLAGSAIQKHNGFVDKYLGDSAMVLFENASDAVKAGIEIYNLLINNEATRIKSGIDNISIGIGAHTGSVMMGVIGDTEHYSSTVISKHVNTASRIEGLTKQVKAGMLISADLMHEIPESERNFDSRYLGLVNPAGSRESIGIFEILNVLPFDIRKKRLETRDMFESAIRNFHTEKYRTALNRFANVVKMDATDYNAKLYYLEAKKRVEGKDKRNVFSFNKK
jgi:class 3 adenylate cyclase/ABC-type amino acid transport substrate-binding protein